MGPWSRRVPTRASRTRGQMERGVADRLAAEAARRSV